MASSDFRRSVSVLQVTPNRTSSPPPLPQPNTQKGRSTRRRKVVLSVDLQEMTIISGTKTSKDQLIYY